MLDIPGSGCRLIAGEKLSVLVLGRAPQVGHRRGRLFVAGQTAAFEPVQTRGLFAHTISDKQQRTPGLFLNPIATAERMKHGLRPPIKEIYMAGANPAPM